jgi:hypothetical protein
MPQPTDQPTSPTTNPLKRDADRLKSDGAATVNELREFLGTLRGRSPQQMLGRVANSGLAQGIFLSTLAFIAIVAVLTVVPYLLQPNKLPDAAAGSPSADDPGATIGSATTRSATGVSAVPGKSGSAADGSPDGERAVEALGIGETRTADPDENPMEDRLDDLLDSP